jgi:exodeoxyribonuclease-3
MKKQLSLMHLITSLRACLLLLMGISIADPAPISAAETLRVMTFNIWVGGDAGKQPLSQTAVVIRTAKADVVGLQETGGYQKGKGSPQPDNGRKLAETLGWHYFDQGERTGILSRFPIVTNTPRKWA